MSSPKSNVKIVVKIRKPIEDIKKPNRRTNDSSTQLRNKSIQKTSRKSKNLTLDKPETNKYSIFSSVEKSNLVVLADFPISQKLIEETFINPTEIYDYSLNLIKESTIMEFDSVYSEKHKLEYFYHDLLKDYVAEMITGKNTCVILFGASESGKTFTLKGNELEKGIFLKTAEDLLNFIEINKQVNQGKSLRTTNSFNLKLSVVGINNDEVNDLIKGSSKSAPKGLKIKKFTDDKGNLHTSIIDVTEREIKTKKEVLDIVETSTKIKKNQNQNQNQNQSNEKKSINVYSLILEKTTKYNDPFNKSVENTTEFFSRIDFIDFPSSEYGLMAQIQKKAKPLISLNNQNNNYDQKLDKQLNRKIENAFNSICTNIVASSCGIESKKDSKISLVVKNTLNKNSNIVFITCVSPIESPPIHNKKALRFSNWMRNQVHNLKENISENNVYKEFEDSDVEIEQDVIEYQRNQTRGEILEKDEKIEYIRTLGDKNIESEHYDEKSIHNNIRKNFNSNSFQAFDKNSNRRRTGELNTSNNQHQTEIQNSHGNFVDNVRNSQDNNEKNKVNSELNQAKINSGIKINESISKNHNESVTGSTNKNRRFKPEYHPQIKIENSKENSNAFYIDDQSKQENMVLKSDLIIFKEENSQLRELNSLLKTTIDKLNNEIQHIKKENNNLVQDRIEKQQEIDRLILQQPSIFNINSITKSINNQRSFENNHLIESRIRELEKSNKDLLIQKNKFEVDYRIVCERYKELQESYENLEKEFFSLQNKEKNDIVGIDNKINDVCCELESIQKENHILRKNEEKLKKEIEFLSNESQKFKEKYEKVNDKSKYLNSKVMDLESQLMSTKRETLESLERIEEARKSKKNETKKKVIEEFQNKLISFKSSCIKNRARSQSSEDNSYY